MHVPLFLIGVLFIPLSLSAQIESLEKKLATTDRDTARVNTLNR
jgi:hypothetical protein